MNEIIKQKGVNFGLILGFLLALVTLLGYAVDSSILASYWVILYIFLVVIGLGLFVIGYSKKALGGFIKFKTAFTAYFIMLVIGFGISTLINLLIFNVVDTDFKDVVKQESIETVEGQRDWIINKMGDASDADIEKIEVQYEEVIQNIRDTDQYSIGEQVKGFFIGTAFFSAFGLLLALILKKNDPELE